MRSGCPKRAGCFMSRMAPMGRSSPSFQRTAGVSVPEALSVTAQATNNRAYQAGIAVVIIVAAVLTTLASRRSSGVRTRT